MTSRQHQDWINRGKPISGTARPLAQLRDLLRAAGYTVYDYPDDSHLDAEPPEDHTPYSETGWPTTSPKWWLHAIDIMPPPAGSKLPSLTALGARVFADRQAGRVTWLKYMNWPSSGSLNAAVQDAWEPGHVRRNSSDTGHIHMSCITGVENLDAPYNPLGGAVLTSVVTAGPTPVKEDRPMFLAFQAGEDHFYLCDGLISRPITLAQVGDLKTLISEGLVAAVDCIDKPRGGFYEGAFGAVISPATIDVAALAAAVAKLLPPAVSVDVAALAAALASALKPMLPTHVQLAGTVS